MNVGHFRPGHQVTNPENYYRGHLPTKLPSYLGNANPKY